LSCWAEGWWGIEVLSSQSSGAWQHENSLRPMWGE
jgi:hypothetical protein